MGEIFLWLAKGLLKSWAPMLTLVIWTTTPWTLPHNRALAFHPDYEYVVAETAQGALLVAADRVASLASDIGISATGAARAVEGKRT